MARAVAIITIIIIILFRINIFNPNINRIKFLVRIVTSDDIDINILHK